MDPHLEQSYVVKFLTLEGADSHSIYNRLNNVYGNDSLLLKEVQKLHKKFMKNLDKVNIKCELDDSVEDDNSNTIEMIESPKRNSKNRKRKVIFLDENSSTAYVKTKRKASLKAKETWQAALCHIKEEEASNEDENEHMNGEEEYEEVDEAFIPENENMDGSEDEDDLRLKSIKLPFLPCTKKIEPFDLLLQLQGNSSYCLLCENKALKFHCKVKAHLRNVHLNHSVKLEKTLSLLCKLGCKGTVEGHYHCPFCEHVTCHSKRLMLHYHKHFIRRRMPEGDKRSKREEIHAQNPICIDPQEGLYLVQKSLLDNDPPLHVIKRDDLAQCSDKLCEQSMEAAAKFGNSIICKHLQRIVSNEIIIAPDVSFDDQCFQRYSLLDQERDRCINILNNSAMEGVSPVVFWPAEDGLGFFSVYCDASFGTFGRTIVKFDSNSKTFQCNCPFPKGHFCPFVILSEIHNISL